MAKACLLNVDSVSLLESKVAGDLKHKRITSAKFDIMSYVKEVYDEVNKLTKDPVSAYTYAQLVPRSVYMALIADQGMLRYYTSKKKVSIDKLLALSDRWLASIDNTIDDLGFNLSDEDMLRLYNMRKEAGVAPNRNTPNPMQLDADLFSDIFSAKKSSWFSTTSNETIVRTPSELVADGSSKTIEDANRRYFGRTSIDGPSDPGLMRSYRFSEGERGRINPNMALQFDFIRAVLKQLSEDVSLNNDTRKVKSLATPNGFNLTVVSNKTIPENQIDDNTKRFLSVGSTEQKRLSRIDFENMLSFVVTDDKGKPLYFKIDKTKKELSKQITASDEKNGKMIYYTLNRVNYKGNTTEVDYKRSNLLDPEEVAASMVKRKVLSYENKEAAVIAITKQYAEQEATINAITKYIGKDPLNNKVRAYAVGGSHGSVASQKSKGGIKGRTSLSKFNFADQKVSFNLIKESGKSPLNGSTFIRTDTTPVGVPVYTEGISTDSAEGPEASDAGMIASFLVDDIYKNGKKLTSAEKIILISPFVRVVNKDLYIREDNKTENLEITVKGEVFSLNSDKAKKKAKQAIFDYLASPYISETEKTVDESQAKGVAKQPNGWRLFREGDEDIHEAVEGDLLGRVYKRKGKKTEVVYHKIRKRTWNIDAAALNSTIKYENFTNFKLTPGKKGVINLEHVDPDKARITYKEWLISKAYVYAKPNIDGRLTALNGYFIVDFEQDDLDVAKGKKKVDKKKAKEVTKVIVKERNESLKGTSDSDTLDTLKGFEKSGLQKSFNIAVTKEQLDAAEKWWPTSPLSKVIPLKVAFNIANMKRPNSVAEWTSAGGILLSKGSDYTDVYHEAWHGFSQLFLNEGQKKKLYRETSQLSGSFTDYKGDRVTFASADEKQLEEYLAEDFRKYMLADGKVDIEEPVRRGVFQYILDILKKLFDKITPRDIILDRESLKSIHGMFEKLRVGNIAEFSFNEANANFKVLDKGLAATGKDKVKDLNYSESKLITDTFDAIIGTNAAAAGSNPSKLMANPKTAVILYDIVLDNMLSDLLEETMKRDDVQDELDKLTSKLKPDAPELDVKKRELQLINDNLATITYVIDYFGDYNNKEEIIEGKGAVAYHLKKTRFLLQKEKSDIFDAMADESDIKRSSHTDKGAQQHSLESLASSDVIMMLKTIYKPDTEKNRLGYSVFEDDRVVWNSIAKVLEGVDGKDKMYELIIENSEKLTNPNAHIFKQLQVLLGNPMEIANNLKHKQFTRWEEFKQAFDRLRVALAQVTIDTIITTETDPFSNKSVEKFDFTIHSGESTGRDKNIVRQWENNFRSIPSKYIVPGLEGDNYLDLVSLFKDPRWVGESRLPKGTEYEFLKAIGAVLSDNETIKKELNDSGKRGYYGTHEIYNTLKGRVDKEATSITSLKDVFRDETTRLKHIAELEAKYNPTAGFMATTAEGATQYEHAQQSSATRTVSSLNDAVDFAAVTAKAHMKHLTPYTTQTQGTSPFNFFTRGSRTLDSLFEDGGMGKKRQWKDGIDIKFEYKNFSGIALTRNTVEHDSGVDAASADETSKLLADMFTFIQLGVSEGARVSDRGSTSLYFTSHVSHLEGTNNKYHSGDFYTDPVKFLKDTRAKRDGTIETDGIKERRRVMMQYISNELLRVKYMMGLPDDAIEHKIITPKGKSYAELGKEFVIFQDVLDPTTQKLLKEFDYQSQDANGDMGILYDQLEEIKDEKGNRFGKLFDKVSEDIDTYFERQFDMFKAKYNQIGVSDNVEAALIEAFDKNSRATYQGKTKAVTLDSEDVRNDVTVTETKIDAIIDAHIANSWMHMYEGMAMFYGDMAIYGDPDTFIKRITGSTSPGLGFSNDDSTKAYYNNLAARGELYQYTNSKWFKERAKHGYEISPDYDPNAVHEWTGILGTSVMAENSPTSAYLKKYKKVLYYASKERLEKLDVKEAAKIAEAEVNAYTKMDEADGQGWITFDSYRLLKKSMGDWSDAQEALFQRILKGDNVPNVDVKHFFPVAKYQHFGPLGVDGSSVVAFHKFSLFPLIPTVIKDTELEAMHNRMVEQNMTYNLFHSGSKVATYTSRTNSEGKPIPDAFKENGKSAFLSADYKFTVNPVFIEYLKDQMAVPDKFKDKVTFSTQLRKIIEVGYMENGVPVDFMVGKDHSKRRDAWESMRVIVKGVEDHEKTDAIWRKASKKYTKLSYYRNEIAELMELKKHELLRDAGIELDSNGNYKGDMEPLLKMVQNELLSQDMAEHEADYIEIIETTRKLKNDLSFSPSAEKIEKILVALVNKRLINQKVNGEGLVLVSDAGFQKLTKPTASEIAKWGTSGLSFYDIETDENGKVIGKRTRAMKVKVAMKGSFEKLLTHPDVLLRARENKVTRLEALNFLIKDDKWLDKGENRKMITMVGVRIPVQGLNSTEFMEVYEFLPKEAGTILIPPADMVAKSGSDFDIDKLMVMMPNIVGLPGGERGMANYTEQDIKAMWTKIKDKGIAISEYRTSDGEYLPIQDPMVETLIRAIFGESYKQKYTATELDEILKAERIKPYEQFRTLFMVKVVENKLLTSMVNMLADPDNFANLIRPNGTYLVKGIATDLADSVRDYNPNYRVIGSSTSVIEVKNPVKKIISGGQTGVDMAGLDAAIELGIKTGGTAAAKFQQSTKGDVKVFNKELSTKYGLTEGKITKRQGKFGTYDDVYYQRTLDNAQEADGTIWFGDEKSAGGRLTLGSDAQSGKPQPLINPKSKEEIQQWLYDNKIKTLNVAGNREHKNPGIYKKAKSMLVKALESTFEISNDKEATGKSASPTRAFELLFNLYKHQAHSVGKQTLGILAVENAMNVLFNSVGAYMSPEYTEMVGRDYYTKKQQIYVKHNSLEVKGKKVVSLSHQFDARGIHNIADVISQLINGAVDVAKDTWIFDIQGNKEVAPTLLFMLQSGIPLKTAIYLVSNPLVREYIKQQKIAKSKFGKVLEQGPSNWRYFRNFARGVITSSPKYGFNWVKPGANFKTEDVLTKWDKKLEEFSKDLDMNDISFDGKLYDRIKDKDGKTTDVDRAAFLQYLDIEDMARGTTDVKMKMNFDTKKTTTTFAAMNKQALIDELMFDGKFPGDVVKRMVDESPIGSFNIQNFIMELWSPLFKIRNNKAFLKFIHDKTRERTFSQDVENTFGEGQSEKFTQQLRNDFAVYIYQNSLKKLDLTKTTFYKGYNVDKRMLINLTDIEVGAFVKDDILYVDDAKIRFDYDTISQTNISQAKKKELKGKETLPESYKEFGFADVRKGMFANVDEYRNFVIERAYLLSVWELKDVTSRKDYQRYLEINKKNKVSDPEDASFQEVIRDMAMDNTFNTWKMFKGSNNAAYELQRIKADYPELLEKYPVLKALVVSQSEARELLSASTKNDSTFKNIRLLNPNLTGSEISMYHDNLIELGNEDFSKIPNTKDNARLSSFFRRLPYLTLFQSGLDISTMYSLGRLMPYQDLQLLVKKASNTTEKLLNNPDAALKEMQIFYMKFLSSNASVNYKTKNRYKNYVVTEIDEERFDKWLAKREEGDEYAEDMAAYAAESGIKPKTPGFITIDTDGNKVYDPEMIESAEDAKRLAAENPDYVFIYDSRIDGKYDAAGNVAGMGVKTTANTVTQLYLGHRDIPNKLGVPLRMVPRKSNAVSDHPNDKTPNIMQGIVQFLAALETDVANGKTPVFPKGGLGQALIGAEDVTGKRIGPIRESAVFDALSKGLAKYGYKNNNHRFTQKGKKFLISTSAVTNEDIEYQMYIKCRTTK